MAKAVRRGFLPKDEEQFSGRELEKLKAAAEDTVYLLDRGYKMKGVAVFVGNHYQLSERQRLALARCVSPSADLRLRERKKITGCTEGLSVNIDGFNTVITLETALSGSLVLVGRDGTIRDLAGLRGTYRIIDKTKEAVRLILEELEALSIGEAVFYLDAPVSNSGRLKALILESSRDFLFPVSVKVIPDVDRTLEGKSGVVTGDAIILNHCVDWINLMPRILDRVQGVWRVSF